MGDVYLQAMAVYLAAIGLIPASGHPADNAVPMRAAAFSSTDFASEDSMHQQALHLQHSRHKSAGNFESADSPSQTASKAPTDLQGNGQAGPAQLPSAHAASAAGTPV